jgi:hypothetical protein
LSFQQFFLSVLDNEQKTQQRIRDPVRLKPLDPGSGSRIRDEKKSGSGMNIQDHFYESLETVFGLKILKFFDADPELGVRNLFDPGSRMEKF